MNFKHLNKKGDIKIILIHGLFATCGYWLNYLGLLKKYQILILEIDFDASFSITEKVNDIEHLIDTIYGGKTDYIFSHSLGTILANSINEEKFIFSFEICPVHSSIRNFAFDFCQHIFQKANKSYTLDFIENKLFEIDELLLGVRKNLSFSSKRIVLFPNEDIFFDYNNIKGYNLIEFKGDHFDIEDAIINSINFANINRL